MLLWKDLNFQHCRIKFIQIMECRCNWNDKYAKLNSKRSRNQYASVSMVTDYDCWHPD